MNEKADDKTLIAHGLTGGIDPQRLVRTTAPKSGMTTLIEDAAKDIIRIVDDKMKAAEKETAERIRQLAKDIATIIGK